MTYAIWKYELNQQNNPLPLGASAKFLKVGIQNGVLVVWFMLRTGEAVDEGRTLRVVMTGETIAEAEAVKLEHIDTVQGGPIVYHVFEVKP